MSKVGKSDFQKGLCIDVILGKSVDMSLVNIGNVYIVDISKQTHFPIGQPASLFINREL